MEEFPLLEEYEHVKPLGQGTYGSVSLWKRKKGLEETDSRPEYVASKSILNSTDVKSVTARKRELHILQTVQAAGSKNMIKYYGSLSQDTQYTRLVMEACHGDLRQLINAKRRLRKKDLRKIGRQILKGLEYIHNIKDSQKILHRYVL